MLLRLALKVTTSESEWQQLLQWQTASSQPAQTAGQHELIIYTSSFPDNHLFKLFPVDHLFKLFPCRSSDQAVSPVGSHPSNPV